MASALKIPFLFSNRYVFGGPIVDAPHYMFKVSLAPEVIAPYDLLLPIPDFSFPKDDPKVVRNAVFKVLERLADNEDVYVGCRGGKGRTGLFMALLAKAVGVSKPLDYVRAGFNPHAVETRGQEDYVADFSTWPLILPVFMLSFRALPKDFCR